MTTDDKRHDLGPMLKQQRVTRELTLDQLSLMSGVSVSHLCFIEQGKRFPSAHILLKMAQPLGFEEVELLTLAGYVSPEAAPGVETPTARGQGLITRAGRAILNTFKNRAQGSGGDIGFREYMHRNYPKVDADLITMMEDLVKRSEEK